MMLFVPVGLGTNFLFSSLLAAVSLSIVAYCHFFSYVLLLVLGPNMDDQPPRLRAEVVQGRNVFPSILCEDCNRLPTQHRCLNEVTTNGYLFEDMLVCGLAICALCSSNYGNEGVFRCEKQSSQLYVGWKQPTKPAKSQQLDQPKRKEK
jgi:hypothetical protein